MRENYYWILLGIAIGILIYLGDKYIFWIMKIIDCITYFNEPLLFELRLNILNDHVDEFLICEAKFTHAGEKKKLNFNIKNFEKFKNKINYIVVKNEPDNLIDTKRLWKNTNSKWKNWSRI